MIFWSLTAFGKQFWVQENVPILLLDRSKINAPNDNWTHQNRVVMQNLWTELTPK
jgi:hypothetical protein